MAVGDLVSGFATVAGSGTTTIRPASSSTIWSIQHIFYDGAANIRHTNGTTTVTFWSDTGGGALLKVGILVGYNAYLVVHNPGSSSINVSYVGIVLKE
jgi:hypothetical protein